MSDHKTSAQIEREIEEERSALTDSLEQLQEQFSPERIMDTVTAQFRDNGGEVARNVARTAKENPIPLALTGIGLAWLIASSNKSQDRTYDPYDDDFDHDDVTWSSRRRAARRYDEISHPVYRSAPYPADRGAGSYDPHADTTWSGSDDWSDDDDGESLGERWGRMSRSARARAYGAKSRVLDAHGRAMDSASDAGDAIAGQARAARGGMSDAANSVQESLTDAHQSVGDRASRAASAARAKMERTRAKLEAQYASAKDEASRRYYATKLKALMKRDRAYMKASELRHRLAEGTESMSESARERVISARLRAYEMQKRVEHATRRHARNAQRFADDQPLVVGAIALALGAAAGAMLPRTEKEDRLVGAYRDRAFDEADRIFREESSKLRQVAEAAIDEGKQVASEKLDAAKSSAKSAKKQVPHGKEAVDKAEAEASSAIRRVAEAASSEAEKQNIGSSVSK